MVNVRKVEAESLQTAWEIATFYEWSGYRCEYGYAVVCRNDKEVVVIAPEWYWKLYGDCGDQG